MAIRELREAAGMLAFFADCDMSGKLEEDYENEH